MGPPPTTFTHTVHKTISRSCSDHGRRTEKSRHLASDRAPLNGGDTARTAYTRVQLADYARNAPPRTRAVQRKAMNGALEVGADRAASGATAAAACRGRSGAHEEKNEGAASAKWSSTAISVAPQRWFVPRRASSSSSLIHPPHRLGRLRRHVPKGSGVSARGKGWYGSMRCLCVPSVDLFASGERARRPMSSRQPPLRRFEPIGGRVHPAFARCSNL